MASDAITPTDLDYAGGSLPHATAQGFSATARYRSSGTRGRRRSNLPEGPRHQLVSRDRDAVLATDLSRSSSAMQIAAPLATTTGAPLAPTSYFGATAR